MRICVAQNAAKVIIRACYSWEMALKGRKQQIMRLSVEISTGTILIFQTIDLFHSRLLGSDGVDGITVDEENHKQLSSPCNTKFRTNTSPTYTRRNWHDTTTVLIPH